MQTEYPGNLDDNGTGAFLMLLRAATTCKYIIMNLDELSNMCVMWRDKKLLKEYLLDENIPNHQKDEKLRKINQSRKAVLENIYTDTTIFGMRKNANSPIVITDGIHRAIGVQRAVTEQPAVKEKICLRLLLFEGEGIASLDDYNQSINLSA
ncbi:hypothetical protein M1437_00560 [Patescibacteria group bacterium]|nr:hypothetical protein [Patescibacteria group bacterium]